jgi:hypothetical protein
MILDYQTYRLILVWCILLRLLSIRKTKHLCSQLYLLYYLYYYMFRPTQAILRYCVYKMSKELLHAVGYNLRVWNRSRYSDWLRADDRGVGVRVPVGYRIFSSPYRPERLWGSPSILRIGYRGLITHQLVPRSRKRGSTSIRGTSTLTYVFMACLIS